MFSAQGTARETTEARTAKSEPRPRLVYQRTARLSQKELFPTEIRRKNEVSSTTEAVNCFSANQRGADMTTTSFGGIKYLPRSENFEPDEDAPSPPHRRFINSDEGFIAHRNGFPLNVPIPAVIALHLDTKVKSDTNDNNKTVEKPHEALPNCDDPSAEVSSVTSCEERDPQPEAMAHKHKRVDRTRDRIENGNRQEGVLSSAARARDQRSTVVSRSTLKYPITHIITTLEREKGMLGGESGANQTENSLDNASILVQVNNTNGTTTASPHAAESSFSLLALADPLSNRSPATLGANSNFIFDDGERFKADVERRIAALVALYRDDSIPDDEVGHFVLEAATQCARYAEALSFRGRFPEAFGMLEECERLLSEERDFSASAEKARLGKVIEEETSLRNIKGWITGENIHYLTQQSKQTSGGISSSTSNTITARNSCASTAMGYYYNQQFPDNSAMHNMANFYLNSQESRGGGGRDPLADTRQGRASPALSLASSVATAAAGVLSPLSEAMSATPSRRPLPFPIYLNEEMGGKGEELPPPPKRLVLVGPDFANAVTGLRRRVLFLMKETELKRRQQLASVRRQAEEEKEMAKSATARSGPTVNSFSNKVTDHRRPSDDGAPEAVRGLMAAARRNVFIYQRQQQINRDRDVDEAKHSPTKKNGASGEVHSNNRRKNENGKIDSDGGSPQSAKKRETYGISTTAKSSANKTPTETTTLVPHPPPPPVAAGQDDESKQKITEIIGLAIPGSTAAGMSPREFYYRQYDPNIALQSVLRDDATYKNYVASASSVSVKHRPKPIAKEITSELLGHTFTPHITDSPTGPSPLSSNSCQKGGTGPLQNAIPSQQSEARVERQKEELKLPSIFGLASAKSKALLSGVDDAAAVVAVDVGPPSKSDTVYNYDALQRRARLISGVLGSSSNCGENDANVAATLARERHATDEPTTHESSRKLNDTVIIKSVTTLQKALEDIELRRKRAIEGVLKTYNAHDSKLTPHADNSEQNTCNRASNDEGQSPQGNGIEPDDRFDVDESVPHLSKMQTGLKYDHVYQPAPPRREPPEKKEGRKVHLQEELHRKPIEVNVTESEISEKDVVCSRTEADLNWQDDAGLSETKLFYEESNRRRKQTECRIAVVEKELERALVTFNRMDNNYVVSQHLHQTIKDRYVQKLEAKIKGLKTRVGETLLERAERRRTHKINKDRDICRQLRESRRRQKTAQHNNLSRFGSDQTEHKYGENNGRSAEGDVSYTMSFSSSSDSDEHKALFSYHKGAHSCSSSESSASDGEARSKEEDSFHFARIHDGGPSNESNDKSSAQRKLSSSKSSEFKKTSQPISPKKRGVSIAADHFLLLNRSIHTRSGESSLTGNPIPNKERKKGLRKLSIAIGDSTVGYPAKNKSISPNPSLSANSFPKPCTTHARIVSAPIYTSLTDLRQHANWCEIHPSNLETVYLLAIGVRRIQRAIRCYFAKKERTRRSGEVERRTTEEACRLDAFVIILKAIQSYVARKRAFILHARTHHLIEQRIDLERRGIDNYELNYHHQHLELSNLSSRATSHHGGLSMSTRTRGRAVDPLLTHTAPRIAFQKLGGHFSGDSSHSGSASAASGTSKRAGAASTSLASLVSGKTSTKTLRSSPTAPQYESHFEYQARFGHSANFTRCSDARQGGLVGGKVLSAKAFVNPFRPSETDHTHSKSRAFAADSPLSLGSEPAKGRKSVLAETSTSYHKLKRIQEKIAARRIADIWYAYREDSIVQSQIEAEIYMDHLTGRTPFPVFDDGSDFMIGAMHSPLKKRVDGLGLLPPAKLFKGEDVGGKISHSLSSTCDREPNCAGKRHQALLHSDSIGSRYQAYPLLRNASQASSFFRSTATPYGLQPRHYRSLSISENQSVFRHNKGSDSIVDSLSEYSSDDSSTMPLETRSVLSFDANAVSTTLTISDEGKENLSKRNDSGILAQETFVRKRRAALQRLERRRAATDVTVVYEYRNVPGYSEAILFEATRPTADALMNPQPPSLTLQQLAERDLSSLIDEKRQASALPSGGMRARHGTSNLWFAGTREVTRTGEIATPSPAPRRHFRPLVRVNLSQIIKEREDEAKDVEKWRLREFERLQRIQEEQDGKHKARLQQIILLQSVGRAYRRRLALLTTFVARAYHNWGKGGRSVVSPKMLDPKSDALCNTTPSLRIEEDAICGVSTFVDSQTPPKAPPASPIKNINLSLMDTLSTFDSQKLRRVSIAPDASSLKYREAARFRSSPLPDSLLAELILQNSPKTRPYATAPKGKATRHVGNESHSTRTRDSSSDAGFISVLQESPHLASAPLLRSNHLQDVCLPPEASLQIARIIYGRNPAVFPAARHRVQQEREVAATLIQGMLRARSSCDFKNILAWHRAASHLQQSWRKSIKRRERTADTRAE